jgi:hypothetical protein
MPRHLLVKPIKLEVRYKMCRQMAAKCKSVSIHNCNRKNKYVTECYRYSRQMELGCKTVSGWHGYIDSRKQLLAQVRDNVYFMGQSGV